MVVVVTSWGDYSPLNGYLWAYSRLSLEVTSLFLLCFGVYGSPSALQNVSPSPPSRVMHLAHLLAEGLSPSAVWLEEKASGLGRRLPWQQKTRLSLKTILSLSFNYLLTVSI